MAQQNEIARTDLLDALMYLKVNLADIREEIIPAGKVVPKHLHHFPVLGYVVPVSFYSKLKEGSR
jgi:hypothetical protein